MNEFYILKKSKINVIYTVNENHFRGNVNLQLIVEKIEEFKTF